MASITLRSAVGRPLTNSEVDANFSALNLELGQKLVASLNLLDLPNPAQARSNLGLGNVENKSSATIRGELTSGNVTGALGYTPLSTGGGTLSGPLVIGDTQASIATQDDYANPLIIQRSTNNGKGAVVMRGSDAIGVAIEHGRSNVSAHWGTYISFLVHDDNVSDTLKSLKEKLRVQAANINSLVPLLQSGNQVLHAGNYTNYSPSLTGAGASGFWDIESRKIKSLDDRNTINQPSDKSAGLYADFKVRTTSGLPGGDLYAGVLTFRAYGDGTDLSGGPVLQIGHTDQKLFARFSAGVGTWNPWRQIIDSSGGVLTGNISVVTGSFPRIGVSDNTSAYRGLMEWDGTAGNAGVRLRNTDNSNFWLNTNGIDFLKSDLNGRITMPYQPAFFAYQLLNGASVNASTGPGVVIFGIEALDRANNWNGSRFTAPVSGVYYMAFEAMYQHNGGDITFQVWKNGSAVSYSNPHTLDNGGYRPTWSTSTTTWVGYLNANDYVEFAWYSSGNSSTILYGGGYYTKCYGYLMG